MPFGQLNFTLITMLLKTSQLVAASYQCHNPHGPLLKVSQVINILFCFIFTSQSLYEIINLFCSEILCFTCIALSIFPRKSSGLFFILNVDIFFPHFYFYYHYSKLCINHIHLSYYSSPFICPCDTIY